MVIEALDERYWSEPAPDCRGNAAGADLVEFARGEKRLQGHVLFRTSGSSGAPRWVALAKAALRWSAERVNEHLGCGPADRWGCALPTDHVGGFGMLARAATAGGACPMFPGKWSPGGFAEFCGRERITVTSLVPTQVYDLVSAGLASPPGLRVAVVGGGALSPDLAGRARSLGWPVRASYGMTETGSQIATEREADAGAQEEGLPLIAPWQAEAESGPEQRIRVKGGGLLTCYVVPGPGGWRLEIPVDDEGWFRTEDVGRVTGDGRLVVEGRAGRVVKILGELVSLDRLDRVWDEARGATQPGEAAISVQPDARRGFAVVLAISGEWDAAELRRCRERFDVQVAPYERIQRVLRVGRIPRTGLGKIRHAELARLLAQEPG